MMPAAAGRGHGREVPGESLLASCRLRGRPGKIRRANRVAIECHMRGQCAGASHVRLTRDGLLERERIDFFSPLARLLL